MGVASEIFLTKKVVSKEEWDLFIRKISDYNGLFKPWKLFMVLKKNKIHYYLETHCFLPPTINEQKSFLLRKVKLKRVCHFKIKKWIFSGVQNNFVDFVNHFGSKDEIVDFMEISFLKISSDVLLKKITFRSKKNYHYRYYRLFLGEPSRILSIDFESNCYLTYASAPKYLDIHKCLSFLNDKKDNAIFSVQVFPYLQGKYYLGFEEIDFYRHSIVFGSSGCGKSKFLSLFVSSIQRHSDFCSKYKIVFIDPHASMERDIGGLGKVVDFKSLDGSISLFKNNCDNLIVSVELLLDVFRGLIPNNYNAKLERVLRYAIYLLLVADCFDFRSLRQLLLDLEYRNTLIKMFEERLPDGVIDFFLTEFNEIKTKSYTEVISPIIALLDEVEIIPIFDKITNARTLREVIGDEFLTVFSLDRMVLGDKVTKIISGLVMQQLFTLIQNGSFSEHIIFIIDEVAVVENPILVRFLAEARKYHLSVVLAGQYFSGISEELKKAIFANVINYYLFRVSKEDAISLMSNIDFKVPLDDSLEQKIKILTGLQDRDCLVRISSEGKLFPAMQCRTLDFESVPRKNYESAIFVDKSDATVIKSDYKIKMDDICLHDILKRHSTNRKRVK